MRSKKKLPESCVYDILLGISIRDLGAWRAATSQHGDPVFHYWRVVIACHACVHVASEDILFLFLRMEETYPDVAW